MSWGALNNHRERKSADPLPDFLTDRDVKSFNEHIDPHPYPLDEIITRKSERPYEPRTKKSRGYGVSYGEPIDILISKKTLFASMIFFAFTVLMAFCIGYVVGGSLNTIPTPQPSIASLAPVKKPIVPSRKKEIALTPTPVESPAKAEPLPTSIETNITSTEDSEVLKKPSDLENNNKDNDEGETVYGEDNSSAENNDVVD